MLSIYAVTDSNLARNTATAVSALRLALQIITVYLFEAMHPVNSTITPISRLPWELLRVIFLYMQDDICARHSLASVCRHWREIILGIPLFWNKLVIIPPYTATIEDSLARLDALFKRSGTLPLDIDWHWAPDGPWHVDDAAAFAEWLLSTIPLFRWKSLRVGIIGLGPIPQINGTFSNLQHLTVEHFNAFLILEHINATANELRSVKLLWNATLDVLNNVVGPGTMLELQDLSSLTIIPKVKRLQVHRLSLYNNLPWVKELTIGNFTAIEGKMIERHLTNLENLVVMESCSDNDNGQEVVLPYLRSLTYGGPWYSFLGCIETPILEMLHLTSPAADLTEGLQTFIEALDCPTYQLSPINLNVDIHIDILTAVQLLGLSPRVEHLSLSIFDNDQWLSISTILLRSRKPRSPVSSISKWELCEHLKSIQFLVQWTQTTEGVNKAKKISSEILCGRTLDRISVLWTDGNMMTFIGNKQSI